MPLYTATESKNHLKFSPQKLVCLYLTSVPSQAAAATETIAHCVAPETFYPTIEIGYFWWWEVGAGPLSWNDTRFQFRDIHGDIGIVPQIKNGASGPNLFWQNKRRFATTDIYFFIKHVALHHTSRIAMILKVPKQVNQKAKNILLSFSFLYWFEHKRFKTFL